MIEININVLSKYCFFKFRGSVLQNVKEDKGWLFTYQYQSCDHDHETEFPYLGQMSSGPINEE